MELIDGNWIKARLGAKRGEKKELADALGIPSHMVTKMLKGDRRVQPEEIPKVVAFFRSRGARSRADILVDLFEHLPPKMQDQAEEYVRYLAEKAGTAVQEPDRLCSMPQPNDEN